MIQIPPDHLSSATLDALIEEFVTRHGTDLSESAQSAAQVRGLLRAGQVVIVFDEDTQTANLVPRDHKPAAAEDTPRRIVHDEPAPPDYAE